MTLMIQPLVTKNWWRRPTIIRYISDSKEIQQDNRRSNYEHNAAFIGAENKTNNWDEWVQLFLFLCFTLF